MRTYQREACAQIVDNPATLLLHDMGAGKTLTVLSALARLKLTGDLPALIVGPKGVITTQKVWEHENEKWQTGLVFGEDVFTITFDRLHTKEAQALLARCKTLVIDELSFLKAWTRRVRSLKKHLGTFNRTIGLTGTPAPNSLMDLFYGVQILDAGQRFGTNKETFKHRYFYPTDYMKYSWECRDEQAIYDKLDGLIHRVEMTDLPQVLVQRIEVPMTTRQQTAYDALQRDFIADVQSGQVIAPNAAVAANKLRQVAAGFVYHEDGTEVFHVERLNAVKELTEAIGKPVIAVYEYQQQKEDLLTLPGAELLGPKVIDRWNAGEVPVLVMHTKSGGHGLNLQHGGNHVIWMSLTWSWELWAQLNARLARPGQREDTVLAHVLHAPGTVEDHVYDVICEKGERELRLLDWASSVAA